MIMKKNVIMKLFTVLSVVFTTAHAQKELGARAIIDSSHEVTKISGTESVVTLKIIDDKGNERVRTIAQATRLYDDGKTEKKLVRFLSPADVKGTGLLTYDYENKNDDIWLYLPALRKTRRIISTERAKSFMGSEFSYADMAPPILDDFTYTMAGEETIHQEKCWKIEMVPKNDGIADENGFSKKISFIAKKDFVLRKALYYDIDGEPEKELSINKIAEVDTKNHKFRPLDLVMINKQNGRKSILVIDKIVVNPEVNDEYFTVGYLEKM